MASFAAAAKALIPWVKLDIALTRDNVVVVGHFQANLHEGCALGKHPVVADSTLEELRAVSPTPVDTLEVVLRRFKSILKFQIELKHDTDYVLARFCNSPANFYSDRCWDRCLNSDPLTEGLAMVLEATHFPPEDVIVSSFEGPRLCNFRHLGTDYSNLKLVGAEQEGAAGVMKTVRMWLGPAGAVLPFATQANVAHLRGRGIRVEVGMPGAGECFHEKNAADFAAHPVNVARLAAALHSGADYVCGDFPRRALALLQAPIRVED